MCSRRFWVLKKRRQRQWFRAYAARASARAIPCAARITREGYEVRIFPQWKDFPGPDPEADAARMNEWMSREARKNPAGYFWPHRRFRTRPEGEPPRYGEGKEWQSEF